MRGWRRKPLHGKLIGWELGRHDDITILRFIAARRPSGRRLLLIFFFFFFLLFFGFRNRWDDALRIRELEGRKKWTAENFLFYSFFHSYFPFNPKNHSQVLFWDFFFIRIFLLFFICEWRHCFCFRCFTALHKNKGVCFEGFFFSVFSFNYLGF